MPNLLAWNFLRVFISMICITTGPLRAETLTWREDAFEDFADGKLDASGENLYVSRDGKIRTIHRFDLNQDGYLDLVFNNTHDNSNGSSAALGVMGVDGNWAQSAFPIQGSRSVALADLNRDDRMDAVFCPSAGSTARQMLSIAWGAEDGWSSRRVNGVLPVQSPVAVAVADLDRDGWPDIAALNGPAWAVGQPAGNIVRIYWGGEHGYLLADRTDLGVAEALDLVAGDMDEDGYADLAILTAAQKAVIFWSGGTGREAEGMETQKTEVSLPGQGATCCVAADTNGDGLVDLVLGTDQDLVDILPGARGREWESARRVPAFPTSRLAVGDLDMDGHPDLVLTRLAIARALGGEAVGAGQDAADAVRILWGADGTFEAGSATELPVPHAADAAVGDINGDGNNDLALAVYQGPTTFQAESRIFLGKGGRDFDTAGVQVQTEGALGVAIAPPEPGVSPRVLFCNSGGGTVDEKVPVQVYWGDADGFDARRSWEIPFRSGYGATLADLNVDGFVDLVLLNSGHSGEAALADPYQGANIFWGGADGFDLERRRTVLPGSQYGSVNAADLNRDGYLDLVIGAFAPDPTIWFGSADGYSEQHRQTLTSSDPATYSMGSLVADFNGDGWLDIGASTYEGDRIRIFWGDPQGFDAERQQRIAAPRPIELEAADLNGDGFLDLIAGSFDDGIEHHQDTGTLIFWGATDGFREWNAQWLPGFTPLGICVADFDKDGFLDLFSPHYLSDLTRESLPCYLYWGSADGFHVRNRTSLINDSASDAMAGDFDRDGWLDLAVSNHRSDIDHHTNSRVFYNDRSRFAAPRVQLLPTRGSHELYLQDMGHIHDRQWRQVYESSIFSWSESSRYGTLTFEADVPAEARLGFSVRSAPRSESLGSSLWQPLDAGGRFQLDAADRCLQYRAILESDNGDRYPILDSVDVELTP